MKPELVQKLREVAMELEREPEEKQIRFPGWDFEFARPKVIKASHAIRDAAVAILNTTDFDSSMKVPVYKVAALIHYIADINEE